MTELIFEEGSKLETIGESAFVGCKISSVKIPNSVKIIGKQAFSQCEILTELIFEEGSQLETIDESAFDDCKILSSVKIPNSVKIIGKKAFYNCESLTKLIFEEGSQLETIDESAFCYCENLNIVKIPNSVKNIGKQAFFITNLLKVEGIKDKIIGENAFKDYNFNKKIEIDDRIINTDDNEIVLKEIKEEEMISGNHKPKGLWYSFGTQWLSLCKDETSVGLEIKENNFKINVNCKILKIKNVKEFDDFEKTYGYGYGYGYGIDWKKVYKNYDGIEIYNENNFQYLFDKKTSNWYKTWEIGSGCIWKNCKIEAERIEIKDEDIQKYIGDIREEISSYDGRKSSSRKRKSKSKSSSRKRKSSSKKRKR